MDIIRTIVVTFTTWVLTALLNGLLAGTWLVLFPPFKEYWAIYYLSSFLTTLVLSTPGYFIYWIVFLTSSAEGKLFGILLRTGLIISFLSAMLFFLLPFVNFGHQEFFLSACTIISTIAAIMIHHRSIQLIDAKKQISHV